MTLRRAARSSVRQGVIGSYVHSSVIDGLGKIGVLVALEVHRQADELAARPQIAMHVAAANPQALDASGPRSRAGRAREGRSGRQVKQQGKPANVIDKIVESGLKTFYKEVCLLDQPFVHDDKKTVAQALKEAEGKAGAPIKITGFVRFALGEGIERQENDFAAEVAAAAGQN